MSGRQWFWVRFTVYVVVTAALYAGWAVLTWPPPDEVDPEDDGLPVAELGALFILGSFFVTALVIEVWLSRRGDEHSRR